MRNGLARFRESPYKLCCGMAPQDLQMTVTVVHDAMGQAGGNEAEIYRSGFGLNSGALGQDPAFEDRDLFVAVAAGHEDQGSGWNRGRARRERRGAFTRSPPTINPVSKPSPRAMGEIDALGTMPASPEEMSVREKSRA